MPEIVYAPTALRQLAHIASDERFAETQRQAKMEQIITAVHGCAAFPRRYPGGRVEGTRERRVSPFKIVYRIIEDGVEIVAIWHDRQNRDLAP